MRVGRFLLLALLSLFLVAHFTVYGASAAADPVSYDESVDGDLDGTQIFAFAIGTNRVSGSTGTGPPFISGPDFDDFHFIVGPGTELTSISYAFSDVQRTENTTVFLGGNLQIWEGATRLEQLLVNILAAPSPLSLFDTIMPLDAGTYEWRYGALGAGGTGPPVGGTWQYTISVLVDVAPVSVVIDIKPGSDANSISPGSKGIIPVAILTDEAFDALQVDPASVRFGPNEASIAHVQAHVEDVDGDGDADLLLHFRTRETGIACGDTEATLRGETYDGQRITGTDAIKTVGCDNK